VTSAQFLIDSESNLQEAIHRMLMAQKEEADSDAMVQGSATKNAGKGTDTKQMASGSHANGEKSDMQEMKLVVDEPDTIAAFQRIIEAYLPIWKALAGDSTADVAQNARTIADIAGETARGMDETKLRNQLTTLQQAASEVDDTDIESARESMKALNRALIGLFQSHDVKLGRRYTIIECPMVKERWIQDEEQVMNPFYGSSMLTCGVKVEDFGT
jgi:hypothetical protein